MKMFYTLLFFSGLLMADQTENAAVCEAFKTAQPMTYEAGMDYFSIMSGKEEKCDSHSLAEWQELSTTEEMGILYGLKYSLSAEQYKLVLNAIKEAHIKTSAEMKELLTNRGQDILANK